MRRDVRRHADRNATRSVDQEVWEPGRKHQWLLPGLVEVGSEVDRVLLDVRQQLHRDLGELALRVAVSRCRVAIDGAEVALTVDEHVPHREVLRHAHQCVVHAGITVRVIVAEHFAHDLCALAVRGGGCEVQPAHGVENAAMHRLEAVASVGDRAPDDHAHRVVQIRGPHLVLDADGLLLRVGWGRLVLHLAVLRVAQPGALDNLLRGLRADPASAEYY